MAVRRTKEDKMEAQLRRLESISYQLPPDTDGTAQPKFHQQHDSAVNNRSSAPSASELLHYDTTLIKRDLIRTALSTTVVFVILIALYFQL